MGRRVANFRIWDAFLAVAAFGVLLFSLGIYAYFGFATQAAIVVGGIDYHMDFDTFWRSAEALWTTGDIYDTGGKVPNLNPPIWTVLISPLGLLKEITAYRVFVMAMLLTSVGYLAWTASELRLRAGWTAVGVVMLLLSTPLGATLELGQIYPLLTLGLVAAWVADQRGRPILAGLALGLVVAIKPSLAPVVLWPLIRRRWSMFTAALASGVTAALVGIIVVGLGETLDWLKLLANMELNGSWRNASLPGAASMLFRENNFVKPLLIFPWATEAAYILGIGLLILTAIKVRQDLEIGLWTLVAASLLASPIAWYDYLVLLGPAVLVLFARGRVALVLLLLALQAIPAQWSLLWQGRSTVAATLALTLYLYILIAHWLGLLCVRKEPASAKKPMLETVESQVETPESATFEAGG